MKIVLHFVVLFWGIFVNAVFGENFQAWDRVMPSEERFSIVMSGAGVLDRETGLVWEKSINTSTFTFFNAAAHCNTKTVGGRRGWRVPSIWELGTLVDDSSSSPVLPTGHPFVNVPSGNPIFWTNVPHGSDGTWALNLDSGWMGYYNWNSSGYIWCVRGGDPYKF